MTCAEFRAMAESYLADELPVDTAHLGIAHLEACESCRGELEARLALRQTLGRAFATAEALAPTDEFRARIGAMVRADAPARAWFARPSSWVALAAGVALAVALGWQLGPSHQAPSALAALAAHAAGDHRDCALHHALEEFPIPLAEAARRHDPRYADIRDIVSQSALVQDGTFSILTAHWCVYSGRSFAHVIVQRGDRVASILLTPVDETPDVLTAATSCPSSDGFQVACFDAPGHAGFVVSDLTAGENLGLARAVAGLLQRHLARG
jgi:hypothetical protein